MQFLVQQGRSLMVTAKFAVWGFRSAFEFLTKQ